MYNRTGKRIKSISKVIATIGIVISCFVGLVIGRFIDSITDNSEISFLIGFLIAGLGSYFAWIGNLLMYAFGELVDSTELNKENSQEILRILKSSDYNQFKKENPDKESGYTKGEQPNVHRWVCDSCGKSISIYPCPECGYSPKSSEKPQRIEFTDHGTIICPNCKTEQGKDRLRCIECGQEFINNQPDFQQ